MIRSTSIHRFAATWLLGLILLVRLVAADNDARYLSSKLRERDNWGGQSWTASDRSLFGGEPKSDSGASKRILVRYHYFVSDYDTEKFAPRWVAHIDTRESASAAEQRKGADWDRAKYRFKPDVNIVTFSQTHHIAWVTDLDFVNANPESLRPVTAYNRLTRGHLASNLEMKGQGDNTASGGMLSQAESFSFANVCPQAQGHNAPLWSALEADCMVLATKLGRVAVISGPVYRPEGGKAIVTTAAPRAKVRIPIPTHFFKIIIATVNGRTEALGFLIPHRSDLKADQRFDYATTVREIESASGINFMAALGKNDELESRLNDELLDLLQKI